MVALRIPFFLCFCTVFWFVLQSSKAYAVEDSIDIFHEENHLRIIRYNVKDQKIRQVKDWTSDKEDVLQSEIDKLDIDWLSIHPSGDVELTDKFNAEKHVVRTYGEIDTTSYGGSEDDYKMIVFGDLDDIFDKRYSNLIRPRSIKRGRSIVEKLTESSKTNLPVVAALPVGLLPGGVKTLEDMNARYLGTVGETVTELTMISFGYEQLHSKYDDNHGLDGVFLDNSDDPECFITESKLWNAQTAKTMLKHFSENQIRTRIRTGCARGGRIKKSMEHLEKFIFENPGSVFKFTHRSVHSGLTQRALTKLDHSEYMRLSGRMTVDSLVSHLERLSVEERATLKGLLPDGFF